MFGLNNDQTLFLRLANKFARGFVSLHNVAHTNRISIHKAIAVNAVNILEFYLQVFPVEDLAQMMSVRD
jgi:hypothetical protein